MQVSKKHRLKAEENESLNDVSIDVSSLNNGNDSSNNTTDLTSLYADETRATIVTPNTNFKERNLHESQLKASPKLVPI